jgi:hypothetical protein
LLENKPFQHVRDFGACSIVAFGKNLHRAQNYGVMLKKEKVEIEFYFFFVFFDPSSKGKTFSATFVFGGLNFGAVCSLSFLSDLFMSDTSTALSCLDI